VTLPVDLPGEPFLEISGDGLHGLQTRTKHEGTTADQPDKGLGPSLEFRHESRVLGVRHVWGNPQAGMTVPSEGGGNRECHQSPFGLPVFGARRDKTQAVRYEVQATPICQSRRGEDYGTEARPEPLGQEGTDLERCGA
jgi:hypothetical protein